MTSYYLFRVRDIAQKGNIVSKILSEFESFNQDYDKLLKIHEIILMENFVAKELSLISIFLLDRKYRSWENDNSEELERTTNGIE